MKVRELMSHDVVRCSTWDDANLAAQRMWDHDCGLVVVETPEGKLAGVVTDRDLCMAAYTRGQPLPLIRLVDVMSRDVVTCAPEEDLPSVVLKLRLHQLRRLPVVDGNGATVGVLALSDLARRAALERGKVPPRIGLDTVADTLAEVSRPRHEPPGAVPAVRRTLAAPEPRDSRPLISL